MESALPLLLFLGLLFFFTLAVLVSGYTSREQERAERGELTIAELFGVTPLLAPLSAPTPVAEERVDPWLVTRIERHVRNERAIATAFLCSPSPRVLQERLAPTPPPSEAWLEELRRFLGRERAAVVRFLSSPSVSLLHPEAIPAAIPA